MLDSTFELISLAASNSLAVFCFCNMIIAILLVDSAKPRSQFEEEERPNDFATLVHDHKFMTKNEVSLSNKASDLIEAEEEKASSVTVHITTVENEEEGRPAEVENVENDDDDDELRKRVEEFIEKINREWRAEKLKTYSLGQ